MRFENQEWQAADPGGLPPMDLKIRRVWLRR